MIETHQQNHIVAILAAAVKRCGGQRQFASAHGMSLGYVNDVLHLRRLPGKAILDALGYEKQVRYVPKQTTVVSLRKQLP